MSRTLLLFLLCLVRYASAQEIVLNLPVDSLTHLVTFSKTVACPGFSKSVLFTRANRLISAHFSPLNGECHSSDESSGLVEGTGRSYFDLILPPSSVTHPIKMWYTVQVTITEGRYTYTINHFKVERAGPELPASYMREGPIEAFLLAHYSNSILWSLTQQERRAVQSEVEVFLSYFNHYILYD